jgi:DNA/RNA endonuclease YhcR with UshA esterase domain
MKKLIFVLGLLLLFISAHSASFAQDVIASKDAKDNIGKTATVKGKVASIFASRNGNTYINFDEKSPNQTFTVVLFKDAAVDISKITEGSILTVSGEIKDYKGKPEIVLTKAEQIISIE